MKKLLVALTSLSLQMRITFTIGLVALLSSVSVGYYAYTSSRDALVDATRDRLALIANSRAQTIGEDLSAMARDIETLSDNAVVGITLDELLGAYRTGEQQRVEFQAFFTEGEDAEARVARNGDGNRTIYAWRHSRVHPSFRSIMAERGYADIIVISSDGDVVYSVAKYGDFAEKIDGPVIAGTALEAAFRGAVESDGTTPVLVDFAPYAPANGEPSAFLATPAFAPEDRGGGLLGAVVYRITPAKLDARIASREGLGVSGESYLFGSDGVLRSNRPLVDGVTALSQLSRPAVEAADTGSFTYVDENGRERFAEKRAISWLGQDFFVVTDLETSEALQQVAATGRGVMIATLTMLGAALLLAFLTGRSIVKPIRALTEALRGLAEDSNVAHVAGEERRDEIGDIARAVCDIRDRVQMDAAERQRETERAQRRETEARGKMMHELADDLEAAIGEAVATLGREAEELTRAANSMAQLSEEARDGSDRVAGAASTASHSVQDVASSTEQLSSSIVEISQLIARSAAVTNETNEFAADTSGVVMSLNECAARIGEIVGLIESIANQTNLLALNATIEAARAGEAGKGFAVVAQEVKGLATQTAKATEEIGLQIEEMRVATLRAVDAVGQIQTKVGEISSAMTSVSAAVEEQSAATQTIAHSADVARGGAASVSDDIQGVRSVIVSADEAADVVVRTAAELQKQAAGVNERVRSFVAHIKAA
ncbi:MAG: methyl-accepting chemotaxis protein [Microvirga sp.]|nr:methyl-accepting chemotaxis protein [Microvirga sp.]